MRALIATVLVAAFAAAGVSASVPTGSYCGDYMFVISGKITFNDAETFDLKIDVAGDTTTCTAEKFIMAPTGNLLLPNLQQDDDCVGQLMKSNSLSKMDIQFNSAHNTIALDVGAGKVTLKRC
jgi:hypothetical protein